MLRFMKSFYLITIAIIGFLSVSAQGDTIVTYTTKYGNFCVKSQAFYIKILYLDSTTLWHRKTYFISNSQLKHDYTFLDKTTKLLEGKGYDYTDNGALFFEGVYKNGKIISGSFFEPNGKKAGYAEYDTSGKKITLQQGWDEDGKEIPNYIFERRAEFSKKDSWVKYVQRNLNADVPKRNSAPPGRYTITVTLAIGIDGSLSEIAVANDPGYGTKEEVIRLFSKSPKWLPAIENNKPIITRTWQNVTFMVSPEEPNPNNNNFSTMPRRL